MLDGIGKDVRSHRQRQLLLKLPFYNLYVSHNVSILGQSYRIIFNFQLSIFNFSLYFCKRNKIIIIKRIHHEKNILFLVLFFVCATSVYSQLQVDSIGFVGVGVTDEVLEYDDADSIQSPLNPAQKYTLEEMLQTERSKVM